MSTLRYNPLVYSGFDREGTGGAPGVGPIGPPGMDGDEGPPGEDGLPGLPGPTGPTGAAGATGPAGAAGVPGLPGDDGEDGFDGLPGPVGPQGAAGLTGAPGFPGLDGDDGLDSLIPGPMGLSGLMGPQGPPGLDGLSFTDDLEDPLASLLGTFADDGRFFVRKGRRGGQEAYGGTVGADSLQISANVLGFVQANAGRINIQDRIDWPSNWTLTAATGSGLDGIMTMLSDITIAGGTNIFPWMNFGPNIAYSGAQSLSSMPAFWAHPHIHPTAAVADTFALWTGILSAPQYAPDVNGASTYSVSGFYSDPGINRDHTNTCTVDRLIGYAAWPSPTFVTDVGAGGTATLAAGLHVEAPGIAGTITNLVGVDIASLTGGSTLNLSLRSAGTTTEQRHAGPVIFGVSASGPDTTAGAVMELERTHTITGAVTDGYAAGFRSDPGYSGAFTVTRHNYWDVQNVSTAASAVVTDAAVMRFDAAIGTHKALASNGAVATTLTSVGPTGAATTVQGWMKINVNGTLRYMPFW